MTIFFLIGVVTNEIILYKQRDLNTQGFFIFFQTISNRIMTRPFFFQKQNFVVN